MKKTEQIPQRFFGPLSQREAEDIADRMLDEKALFETLVQYLTDDFDSRQLAYELQVIAENIAARIKPTREERIAEIVAIAEELS